MLNAVLRRERHTKKYGLNRSRGSQERVRRMVAEIVKRLPRRCAPRNDDKLSLGIIANGRLSNLLVPCQTGTYTAFILGDY